MRIGRMTSNAPGSETSWPSAGKAVAVTAVGGSPTKVSAEPASSREPRSTSSSVARRGAAKPSALRRQLQPDLGIVRELHRLKSVLPGLLGLVMQIEVPSGRERARPDYARAGRGCAARHIWRAGSRGRAPCSAGASLQRKPSLKFRSSDQSRVNLRAYPGLYGGAGFGLAMNARGKTVGALPLDLSMDRHRAIDAVAAAIERDRPRTARHNPRRRNWHSP